MISNGRPLPPIYFFLAIVAMVMAHYFYPITRWTEPPYSFLGVIPITISVALVFRAAGLFGRIGTTIKPYQESQHLVVQGPYRFTRNPMYLGMVGILSGFAILLGTLSPILVIPTFALLIQEKFIRVEEAMLEKTFGDEYRRFCERVRRWI